jgi:hypothetical protein
LCSSINKHGTALSNIVEPYPLWGIVPPVNKGAGAMAVTFIIALIGSIVGAALFVLAAQRIMERSLKEKGPDYAGPSLILGENIQQRTQDR